jgi:hypothetical protein
MGSSAAGHIGADRAPVIPTGSVEALKFHEIVASKPVQIKFQSVLQTSPIAGCATQFGLSSIIAMNILCLLKLVVIGPDATALGA